MVKRVHVGAWLSLNPSSTISKFLSISLPQFPYLAVSVVVRNRLIHTTHLGNSKSLTNAEYPHLRSCRSLLLPLDHTHPYKVSKQKRVIPDPPERKCSASEKIFKKSCSYLIYKEESWGMFLVIASILSRKEGGKSRKAQRAAREQEEFIWAAKTNALTEEVVHVWNSRCGSAGGCLLQTRCARGEQMSKVPLKASWSSVSVFPWQSFSAEV